VDSCDEPISIFISIRIKTKFGSKNNSSKDNNDDNDDFLVKVLRNDKEALKRIYSFSFIYSLEPGSRTLPLMMAVELWKMILPFTNWSLINFWLEYTSAASAASSTDSSSSGSKRSLVFRGISGAISRDTWMMVYDLIIFVNDDLSDYEGCSQGSWPVLIDSFIEFARKRIETSSSSSSLVEGGEKEDGSGGMTTGAVKDNDDASMADGKTKKMYANNTENDDCPKY
jgi:hypothetical protein